MPSMRLTQAFCALTAQGLLGAVVGFFLGGALPAGIGAAVAGVASIVLTVLARDATDSAYRQFVLATILTASHLGALYTLGDDGTAPLLSAQSQLLLAVPAFAACLALAARAHARRIVSPPADTRSTLDDDDPTLEIGVSSEARPDTLVLETLPAPSFKGPLVLGVLSISLLIVSAVYWLGDDAARPPLGGAVARELSAGVKPAAIAAPVVPDPVPAPAPPDDVATGTAPPPAPAASGSASGPDPVAPSAARRECMAQIESAHLFLQIARQSVSQDAYSQATAQQIAQMLKKRPVGPRTLDRIAQRMWEQRDAPERGAAWWSSQYSRCEAARSGGSWYVVRG